MLPRRAPLGLKLALPKMTLGEIFDGGEWHPADEGTEGKYGDIDVIEVSKAEQTPYGKSSSIWRHPPTPFPAAKVIFLLAPIRPNPKTIPLEACKIVYTFINLLELGMIRPQQGENC
ncbi:hypothetical protein OPQ81_010876 [Rhizoctonia solani]|nr:hypothetical protein OPQ81_010876 [Rhizoctonia solani]